MFKAIETIEQQDELDKWFAPSAKIASKLTSGTVVKNVLSGTWLGHPLHPMLSDIPIGAWSMATVLDLTSGQENAAAARRLVGVGILAALPTAASGASDWADTYGPDQRVGWVHAITNSAATGLQIASWVARRRGRHTAGTMLSLAGVGLTAGAGYLGGHLSFVRGVGVNHTAFEHATTEWTDVAAESELTVGKPLKVTADGVSVVLVQDGGRVRALSSVCTHAGGPLDEGEIKDGCIRCPWHGSEFRLSDGAPTRGPASVAAPMWETKIEDGRVQIRAAH